MEPVTVGGSNTDFAIWANAHDHPSGFRCRKGSVNQGFWDFLELLLSASPTFRSLASLSQLSAKERESTEDIA